MHVFNSIHTSNEKQFTQFFSENKTEIKNKSNYILFFALNFFLGKVKRKENTDIWKLMKMIISVTLCMTIEAMPDHCQLYSKRCRPQITTPTLMNNIAIPVKGPNHPEIPVQCVPATERSKINISGRLKRSNR